MRARPLTVLCLLAAAAPALAEPFGFVRSEHATNLVVVGSLGDLLLILRNGESVDAVQPGTGTVVRSFARPPDVPRLGAAAVAVGSELWVGAPEAGVVLAFDAGTGGLLRRIAPGGVAVPDAAFGFSLAATSTRVIVGAPASEGGDGAAYAFDPTGALVRGISAGSGGFGDVVAAGGHALFVSRPTDGPFGEVHQLDEDGNRVRVLTSGVAEDLFGASVAVVGETVFVGAPQGALGVGRLYRFDVATGAALGTIEAVAPSSQLFGTTLFVRGDALLVGEPAHSAFPGDPLGSRFGGAYLIDAASGFFRATFAHPAYAGGATDFGRAVASAGPFVAVGDPLAGGVYVFADLPHCGDGALDPGERCDDGNPTSGDGCDANCTPTACGNGVRTAGEACDDGNQLGGDACGPTCLDPAAVCGDGVRAGAEACDDGNLVDGDGCDHDCTLTGCGNAIVTAGEECDDGNDSDADTCSHDCKIVGCGNGVLDGSEECDDGNVLDEDGCSPFCTPVAGPYGVGVTNVSFTYFSAPFGGDRRIDARILYPAAAPPPPGTPVDRPPRYVPAAAGRFPLLLQSHGFGASSLALIEHDPRGYFLARNGYIVAAPLHPEDNSGAFAKILVARPIDLRLLLDHLLDPATVPVVLRNHVDADRVGAMGHSLGGITATATAVNGFVGSVRDPRIKAVLGTAAENYVFSPSALATSRVPIMLLIGDDDEFFSGPASVEATYAAHQAPRFLVEIPSGTHLTPYFPGICALAFCSHRGAVRYPLAFFDTYLKNDRSEVALLAPGAEGELAVKYFRDPGPALSLGGTSRTDCMVALAAAPGDGLDDTPLRNLACTDGAACDADPAPRRCGFDVRLCVNAVDRRAIACTPTDVASLGVENPSGDAELDALQSVATALGPTSDRRCTAPVRLTVPIPGRKASGRRRLRVRAVDAAGRRDADRFVLSCKR